MTANATAHKPYDLTTAGHDYPAWEGPPKRTVLICSHPRSGSTLLGEALYFAGGLGCPLEYFHVGFMPGLAARWGTHGMAEQVCAVRRFRTDPSGTLSVKLFWRDVQDMALEHDPVRFAGLLELEPGDADAALYRDLGAMLADAFPNAEMVHLWRRDRVRQGVSALAAVQTGQWRSISGAGDTEARPAIDYDFDRIDKFVALADFANGHWRNFFAANGVEPYPLTYEALTGDYDAAVSGVLRHFGVGAPVPPIRMRRQSGSGNEALVLRYLREHRTRSGR